MPTDDGTSGQALVTDGSGVLSWSTAASGDVYGPASATDNAIARFDGTTGKIIQNSVVTIADTTGNMAGVGTLSSGAITSSSLTSGRVPYAGTAGLIQDAAAFTFDGTILSATRFAGALNGTVGATTASTGAFTTLSATGITTVAAGSAALPAIVSTTGTADTGFWFPAADTIAASTAGTERMRINSVGAVGIGGTPVTGQTLFLAKSVTGNVDSTTVRQQGVVASDVTSSVLAFDNVAQTAASVFTLTTYGHFHAQQGSFGAGSTVTNQYGFFASSTLTGATNNYGFYSAIASGTGRWNFYAAGTAANYFAGSVTCGAEFSVSTGATQAAITINSTNNSVAGPSRLYVKSGTSGTFYATVNTTLGEILLTSPAAYSGGATIHGLASENHSATNLGGFLSLRTTPNATTTATERLRIGQDGVTSIGATPGSESLRVTPVASAVNFLEINGAISASKPFLYANGSDASVSMNLVAKGAGSYTFLTSTGTATQFVVAHTASAVNYLQVTGASTGNGVVFSAQGSDTNITTYYATKGTGFHSFVTGGNTQFLVLNTASAVNNIYVTGAATGAAPAFVASGSDTNIDLALTPKGTGNVRFGTYTAGILAQAGYITIKDAGGTTRNLLVG
jgi:hypothetical protein